MAELFKITIVQTAIRIRYRLLPYIYSGFFEVSNFDYTMQRTMVLNSHQTLMYQINDQFMFGHSILVAPIYTELQSRDVYLPMIPTITLVFQWQKFKVGLRWN